MLDGSASKARVADGCLALPPCSSSGKLLLMQCGAPDWVLQAWRWQSGRLAASVPLGRQVTQVRGTAGGLP
jgi:hypothetical protein